MEQSTISAPSLVEALDRLARIEPSRFPVISLYVDARPDNTGRHHWRPFVRKELAARARTFPLRSPERESVEKDMAKITRHLEADLRPAANGVAIFACAGSGLFEVLSFEAPIAESRLYVSDRPHLYPLARLADEYPRVAVLLADTRSARLFVFGRGRTIDTHSLVSPSISRTSVGGWSQMRYQRHVDHLHKQHAREAVEALVRVVREDRAEHVWMAGDEVIVPLLKQELPPEIEEKLVDVLPLGIDTSEQEVGRRVLEALRELDAADDRERVERLLGEYRAGGLAVVGPEETRQALEIGQVDELLINADLDRVSTGEVLRAAIESLESTKLDSATADQLVILARQTSARVTFIEDPALLRPVGGVGAHLRYHLAWPMRNFPRQEKTTSAESPGGKAK